MSPELLGRKLHWLLIGMISESYESILVQILSFKEGKCLLLIVWLLIHYINKLISLSVALC